MEGKINLAWAIEVPYGLLGARLETYMENEAKTTALEDCLSAYSLTRYPLSRNSEVRERKIPKKVIGLIGDAMRATVSKSTTISWTQDCRCMRNQCEVLDHFATDRIKEPIHEVSPSTINDWYGAEASQIHGEWISDHLDKILNSPEGKFARYIEDFESKFHIRPFFSVLPSGGPDDGAPDDGFQSVEIAAFLTMPIFKVPIKSELGFQKASFTVQQRTNVKEIPGELSVEAKQWFRTAVRALKLEAAHTNISIVVPDSASSQTSSSSESDAHMVDSEDESLDLPRDAWGRVGKFQTFCMDCGDSPCKGKYQAPEPAMMVLACGEMETY